MDSSRPYLLERCRSEDQFHYDVVIVGPASKYLGTVTGSCWADKMDLCSRSIFTDIAAEAL